MIPPKNSALAEKELCSILEKFGCQAGTVHLLSAEDGLLHLVAAVGIPAPVLAIVAAVPVGKGMAGLAAQRNEPVSLCNLQTDTSGQAKPGARATRMEGSVAIPMRLEGRPECVIGVLGAAKPTAYEYSPEELAGLLEEGARLAALLA